MLGVRCTRVFFGVFNLEDDPVTFSDGVITVNRENSIFEGDLSFFDVRKSAYSSERRTESPKTTIVRLPTVQRRTGLSRSAIYVRMAEGTFPRPVNLGSRAVGWVEADVQQWIEARIQASSAYVGRGA